MIEQNRTNAAVQTTIPATASRLAWTQVVLASFLMLATLPGRTQGLGLITEPLLADLKLDRIAYANLNLWATLVGALACFPAGWAIDRFGLRWVTGCITLLLGLTIWRFSGFSGSIAWLFGLLLLTRGLGQSALSVCSISTVGKWFAGRVGLAMAVYSVLLSVFFAVAFIAIGYSVRENGWRSAWLQIAVALVFVVTPLVLFALREPKRGQPSASASPVPRESESEPAASSSSPAPALGPSLTFGQAWRTGAFWAFVGAAAAFNLVASGLGLFNEAVLVERGFDQKTFHFFLGVTSLMALLGQIGCGWLSARCKFQTLTMVALLLYSASLAGITVLRADWQLWLVAVLLGVASGMIMVIFFSIWSEAFGRLHLGRIQGAAQMLTVLSSAIGPLLFASCAEKYHSYTPIILALAGVVLILALVAATVRLPSVEQ